MNVRLAASSPTGEGEILCGQLLTIAKERLLHYVADLDPNDIPRLNRALCKSLGLPTQ